MKKGIKIFIKILVAVILIPLVIYGGIILWLTFTEYRPEATEKVEIHENISGNSAKQLAVGDMVSVVTWNIGYGDLGDNSDFFMDGGKNVRNSSKERVLSNLTGINTEVKELEPDVVLFQEIDYDSKRSRNINELDEITKELAGYEYAYTYNYKVNYVPYPFPTIGKVNCGVATLSLYDMTDATRIALPCPFSYPSRVGNLKRCLLVSRIPIKDSDKELVVVNLHLEAYDDGEGKAKQTQMLAELLKEEAKAGNYVIAAGDFNQTFSNCDISAYPVLSEELWKPGTIDVQEFGNDLNLYMNSDIPSCRSLDKPYEDADWDNFQYYVIDGYILSKNLQINLLETQNLSFKYSDHEPVLLRATLK